MLQYVIFILFCVALNVKRCENHYMKTDKLLKDEIKNIEFILSFWEILTIGEIEQLENELRKIKQELEQRS